MTVIRRIFSITALLLAGWAPALAQSSRLDTLSARYDILSSWFAPEKLYLHMDRTAFHAGETIWFNGYLQNASPRMSERRSNYMYVELLAPDGTVEKRVKIKRDGEGFPGHMDLSEELRGGEYTLRAYTMWQMNFSDSYMFHQRVDIVGDKQIREAKKPKSDAIDVSFYPEGGRWFAGLPARIGFKVMDSQGRSVDLEGYVRDKDGEIVTRAVTRHDGMGVVQFISEQAEGLYFETDAGERFPLPAAEKQGASISVIASGGKRMVRISGAEEAVYDLILRDLAGMRYVSEVAIAGNVQTVIIPDDSILPGINTLMLVGRDGRTVSERHFFRYDDSAPGAQVSCDGGENPGNRVPVTASLSLNGADGSPLDGVFSVSVVKSSISGNIQDDGIGSYLALSSELHGSINEPRHYFDPSVSEKERALHLDLLMMIQGWSYYDMELVGDPNRTLGEMKHPKEDMQFIKGRIKRPLSGKAPKNFSMLVLMPKIGASKVVSIEEGSRFIMDSLDFEEGTGIMIKVKRLEGIGDYVPSWEGEPFAAERSYAAAPGRSGITRAPVSVDYEIATDTLVAAVLTAESVSSDLGINGHVLPKEDQKAYASMRLIEYLRIKAPSFTYQDGLMYSIRSKALDGYGLRTNPDSWDESPVQLVVDGAVEPWEGFEELTIGETESIAISTQPDILYRAKDGVVAVRLQYGVTVSSMRDKDQTMVYFTPLGWQTPQKFYSPRYDRGDSQMEADRRNTIYWNPAVKVKGGKGAFTFCTSDEEEFPYSIVVEGVTSDGKPFSATGLCGGRGSF